MLLLLLKCLLKTPSLPFILTSVPSRKVAATGIFLLLGLLQMVTKIMEILVFF